MRAFVVHSRRAIDFPSVNSSLAPFCTGHEDFGAKCEYHLPRSFLVVDRSEMCSGGDPHVSRTPNADSTKCCRLNVERRHSRTREIERLRGGGVAIA